MKFYIWAACLGLGLLAACGGKPQDEEQSTAAADTVAQTTAPADTAASTASADTDMGKGIYSTYCLACHQADGKGVPGLNPPLAQSEWVTGDKKRLIGIILKGMTGDITVNGEKYNGAMPQHDFLKDEEIAAVLTYVRANFGNTADAVSTEEVKAERK